MTAGAPSLLLAINDDVAKKQFAFAAAGIPPEGSRVYAAVRSARVGPGIPISFTAFGLIWSTLVSQVSSSTRLTVYEAKAVNPSGTAVNVDLDDGGTAHTSCSVVIVAHPKVTGTLQPTSATSTSTLVSVALAAIRPGDGVGMFGLSTAAVASFVAEAGYTKIVDFGVGTGGAARMTYIWRPDSADNTPLATANASGGWIAAGFELAVSYFAADAVLAGAAALTADATRIAASRVLVEPGQAAQDLAVTILDDAVGVTVLA